MPVADAVIADEIVGHAINLLRLSVTERKTALGILTRLEKDITKRLSSVDITDLGRRDLSTLVNQARAAIDEYYARVSQESAATMQEVAVLESEFVKKTFEKLYAGLRVSLPPQTFFKTLLSDVLIQGAPSSQWWERQAGDTKFRFAAEIRQGVSQAETNSQLIKRIVGTPEDAGVMEVSRRNAAALTQTSVQAAANASRMETFRANRDIVKGVRQLSTLDGRTSTICVAYSGGMWDLDGEPLGGTTLPFNGGTPRHFNCRSVMTAITRSFKELGIDTPEKVASTRASDLGQIEANTTFEQFIDRKPKEYLDDLLGVGKAQLYRDGKITLQNLLDMRGNPLTLNELRAKYAL